MSINRSTVRTVIAALCFFSLSQPVWAEDEAPVMDYASLLSQTIVMKGDQVFAPGFMNPYKFAFSADEITAKLTRKGESQPLQAYSYRSEPVKGAMGLAFISQPKFLPLNDIGEGDFSLTFSSGDTTMTVFDFSVAMVKSGDSFNPVVEAALEGDWPHWALLRIPFGNGERDDSNAREPLHFVNWARIASGGEMSVEIRLDGDVIAHGRHFFQKDAVQWQRGEYPLKFPDNKGGKNFKVTDLLARDGIYDVFFTSGDDLVSAFQLEIEGGKEVYHPRQASDYTPRSEYLLPRQYVYDNSKVSGFDVVYMRALSSDVAEERFITGPPQTKVAGSNSLAKWQWQPSGDPARKTTMTLTEVETDADTTIRVGDEVIVFGTDYPTGVAWMKVGETEARSIPEGETFDSKVFGVCGRKIVLVRKYAVSIFDTDTGKITPIPESDIRMNKVSGGIHAANQLVCDGHLAAVVNNTEKVADKLTIKVIDLSGDTPKIIPIKNGPYQASRVNNIAISAAEGMIAITTANDKTIHIAPVGLMANQTAIKLEDYKSIRSNQVFIDSGGIVYADQEYKVRFLPFGSTEPRRLTDQAFGGSSNGYFADHGRLVFVTSEKFGTRFEIAVGGLDGKPKIVEGTGTAIKGTSGSLGMAGVGAITPDGTVFLAGTPSGGIGTGEHLQILDTESGSWRAISNGEGTIFGAIDVVAGERVVAFKHGGRSSSKIGYISFGEKVEASALFEAVTTKAAAEATPAAEAEATKAAEAVEEMVQETVRANQQDMALLSAYMTSEKQMSDAFTAAFGEEEGKKKARTMTIEVMKTNGLERLVPIYEKMME